MADNSAAKQKAEAIIAESRKRFEKIRARTDETIAKADAVLASPNSRLVKAEAILSGRKPEDLTQAELVEVVNLILPSATPAT